MAKGGIDDFFDDIFDDDEPDFFLPFDFLIQIWVVLFEITFGTFFRFFGVDIDF